MYTLDQIPHRVEQKGVKIDPKVLADQLHLNGRLQTPLVDNILKRSKNYVVQVFPTDFGIEALVSGEKDGKTVPILPGFYVARNSQELTVQKELARMAKYTGEKYMEKLGFVDVQPIAYPIDRILDVNPANKEVTVQIKPTAIDCKTELEYWNLYVKPMLDSVSGQAGMETWDRGKAMRALAEAYRHQVNSKALDHLSGKAELRKNAMMSIWLACEMMQAHARTGERGWKIYATDKGAYFLQDSIEYNLFYNPQSRDRVFAGEINIKIPSECVIKAEK